MLTAKNIQLHFGDRVLFDNITFEIKPKDRIGLVGKNGVGKSTLLRILSNRLAPDQGTIDIQGGKRLGYLEQELTIDPAKSVRKSAKVAFPEIVALETKLEKLETEIAESTDYESEHYYKLLDDLSESSEQLALLGADRLDEKIEKVLKGLGFKSDAIDRPLNTFSGGWQMRAQLAAILLNEPEILLLDEPTNHLDMEAIIWLEEYIRSYNGAVLLISHDKMFLQQSCNRILELSLGKLEDYRSDYDNYLVQRQERRQNQIASFENQQKLIAQKEKTIKRFMAKATKTKMAQSMQKQLDKIERVTVDQEDNKSMRIQFLPALRSAKVAIQGSNLSKSYGALQVLKNLDFELLRGDKVAVVGQNGQGKTTLLKVLNNFIDKDAGAVEVGTNVQIGYYAQNQAETLPTEKRILEFMEDTAPEESFSRIRSILGAFLFSGEEVEKKISVLSGGERARVALAHMLLQPINVLYLDEPTNHLDMHSKDILKQALMQYEGALVVVSHDRDFLSGLTNKVLELRDYKANWYLGDVNYFLEKRQKADLRAVTVGANPSTQKVAPVTLSNAERKRLKNALQKAEKEVMRLEAAVEKLESQMLDPSLFQTNKGEKIQKEYAQTKAELSEAENQWEQIMEAYENAETS